MGSSPQDEKLALLVVRDGLLTAERLDECRKIQARLQPPRSLAQIIVARHYATADQLRDLVAKEVTKRTSSRAAVALDPDELEREDQELAKELKRLRLVEDEKLRECVALTRKARQAKPDVRLAQILLKKNYVTRDSLRDVLTNLAALGRVSPPRNTTLRPALDPSAIGEGTSSNMAQRTATPPTARPRSGTQQGGWPTGPSSGSNPVAPLFGASGAQAGLFGEASGVVSGPLFGVDASSALGPSLPDRASSGRMTPLTGPPSGRITSGPRPAANLDEPPRDEAPPPGYSNPFAETLPFPDPWAKRSEAPPSERGFPGPPPERAFPGPPPERAFPAPSPERGFPAPSPVFMSEAPRGASPFEPQPFPEAQEPLLPLPMPELGSPLGLPAKDARGNYHTVELDPRDPALPKVRRGLPGAPDEEDPTESPTKRHMDGPAGDPFGESREDANAFDAFGSVREAKPVPPRVGGATNFVPLDESSGGGLNLFDSPAPFVPPASGALARDPFASDEPLGLGSNKGGNAGLGGDEGASDPFAPGGDGTDPFGAASINSEPGLPRAAIGLGRQAEEPPPEEPKRGSARLKKKTKATRARPRPRDD